MQIITRTNSKINEADLILRIFKKFIDAHYYNFSATDAENRLFWNYYRLKDNFKKKDFWKSYGDVLSTNEICIDVLVEYYLQMQADITVSLTIGEEKMLAHIINRFYTQLNLVSATKSNKDYSSGGMQIGHFGVHG